MLPLNPNPIKSTAAMTALSSYATTAVVTPKEKPVQIVLDSRGAMNTEHLVKNEQDEQERVKKIWEKWSKKRSKKPIKLNMCLDYFSNYNFTGQSPSSSSKDLEELTQHFLLSKHPYICVKRLRGLKTLQVSGSFTHELDQLIYLGDLFSIIQENDGLSVSYCKTFSLQLAHAIDFIHKLGLAHRNINTENIFVFEREKSPLIKLSCFDYACALGSLDSTDLIIKRRLKTNPFAPPELQTTLLNGSRDIQSGIASTKEDTWAFAVVVFCMITNHYPWRFSTDRDEHYQSFRDKVLRPHNNQYESAIQPIVPYPWSEFSKPLLEFFLSCLQHNPVKRTGKPTDVFTLVCDYWLKTGAISQFHSQ